MEGSDTITFSYRTEVIHKKYIITAGLQVEN
jgi:hypothetical protein